MFNFSISFWKKESGNLMSHGKGITQEQVDFLKTLKAGDRFIVWKNDKKSETQADYTLRFYEPKPSPTEF